MTSFSFPFRSIKVFLNEVKLNLNVLYVACCVHLTPAEELPGSGASLYIPVVVVTGGSVGFSVLVFRYVLGELRAQRQFLPLLLAIVGLPRDLLRLGWTVDRLQLWSDRRGEEMESRDGMERFRLG